jgi:glutamine synthetase
VESAGGENLMSDADGELTELSGQLIGGIVDHAASLVALTNPTVNAYKRLGPDTLAPYRANWGYDNRSTMLRIPPERGAGTRLELRVGDGAANPYLVIAATLAAGLDGIRTNAEAPDAAAGWAYENEAAEILPTTLGQALDALDADASLRGILGEKMLEVFGVMKRDEIERYEAEVEDPSTRDVTRWELEEYIEYY